MDFNIDFFNKIGQVFLPHNSRAPLQRKQMFFSVGGRTTLFAHLRINSYYKIHCL